MRAASDLKLPGPPSPNDLSAADLGADDTGPEDFGVDDLGADGPGEDDLGVPPSEPDLSVPHPSADLARDGAEDSGAKDLGPLADLLLPPRDLASVPDLAPPRENCFNDLDDDHDGRINNGCPDSLSLGLPVVHSLHGSSSGGTNVSVRCPANSYVTSLRIAGLDDIVDPTYGTLDELTLGCSTPQLKKDATSYRVVQQSVTTSPKITVGQTDHSFGTTSCDGSFAGGWGTVGAEDTKFTYGDLLSLGIYCQAGSVSLSPENRLLFSFTKSAAGNRLGYANRYANPFAEDDCGPEELLVGYEVSIGGWIYGVRPVCAPLVVSYLK